MRSPSLYSLKPRFVAALDVITHRLAVRGTTPNAVTAAGIPVALLGAFAVVLGTVNSWAWLTVPVCALALMALNAIDGSLARSTGQTTTRGAVLNEMIDRLGDLILVGSLAVVAPRAMVAIALIFVLTAEVVALVGWGALGERALVGVMGKPDRALMISAGAVIAVFVGPQAFALVIAVITIGALATTASRISWVLNEATRRDLESGNAY